MPCPFKKNNSRKNKTEIKNILICRTDNIGDIITTLPMIRLLKQKLPQCKITILSRKYTKAIIDMCPDIDNFMDIEDINSLSGKQAVEKIKQLNFDACLFVSPYNFKLAMIVLRSGIKMRIGTGTRPSKFITLSERLPKDDYSKHIALTCIDLLKPLGIDGKINLQQAIEMIDLKIPPITDKIAKMIDPKRFSIILHPLSNGHGKEWPLEHYAELAAKLDRKKYQVFITGSEKEKQKLADSQLVKVAEIENTCGRLSLEELIIFIKHVDCLVASGTGPLHIAAAAGIKTLGLFPRNPGVGITKWQALGKNTLSISCDKPCQNCSEIADCTCMNDISASTVEKIVDQWANNIK